MINFRKIGVHVWKLVDHLVTTSARRTCRARDISTVFEEIKHFRSRAPDNILPDY